MQSSRIAVNYSHARKVVVALLDAIESHFEKPTGLWGAITYQASNHPAAAWLVGLRLPHLQQW